MPAKNTIHSPTAYELRRKVVDPVTAKELFDRGFALAAFSAGAPGRKDADGKAKLTVAATHLIEKSGHADLASSCLAFLLSIESDHERPEEVAYLALVRQIRDAAKSITVAANELTDQMARHHRETGLYEQMRGRALYRMAQALHERWASLVAAPEFMLQTIPQPIDNALADGRWIHGLSCSALYDEADAILKNHEQINAEIRHGGLSVMASGNRADHDRDAFIRDIAAKHELVFGRKPSARDDADGNPSPFMRFVGRVYEEFRSVYHIDRIRYLPPSASTVRSILEWRRA